MCRLKLPLLRSYDVTTTIKSNEFLLKFVVYPMFLRINHYNVIIPLSNYSLTLKDHYITMWHYNQLIIQYVSSHNPLLYNFGTHTSHLFYPIKNGKNALNYHT